MSLSQSSQAPKNLPKDPVEMLSAYLDGELAENESSRVEEMLERDPDLRRQLAGLRSISVGLGHLERLAPPPTLGQDVTRRIALAGEKRSLLDRIEDGLPGVQGRQSNIFLMFAVILALAIIMYFFSHSLERNRLTPVTFDDLVLDDAGAELDDALTVFVAGRLFQKHWEREGHLWIEEGLDPSDAESARRIDLDASPEWLESRPELRGVALLGHAVLRVDGEIVELVTREGAAGGAGERTGGAAADGSE